MTGRENAAGDLPPRSAGVTTDDGRRLATFTWGDGADLVVLEAGLGFGGRYWGPTARLVGAGARVISYDRAGYGTSTPDGHPRTLDRLADDLCTVVKAHRAGRVVLVGHSWGGPIVRRAVTTLPGSLVTGLVLVDPTDEGATLYDSRAFAWSEQVQAVLLPLMARTGLLWRSLALMARDLPEPDRRATLQASSSPTAAETAVEEGRHVRAGLVLLRTQCPPDVPVTVISGVDRRQRGLGRAGLIEAHRRRAAACPRGRFVGATASTHLVPLTEPARIAGEIDRILSAR